jgi:hypothetical protein
MILVDAKEPWEMTRSAFCREFVFHVTSSAILSSLRAEGMSRGSFMIGHVPDFEGDLLVMARRSDVESKLASHEEFGKGEALRPFTRDNYVMGPISWESLLTLGVTKKPHYELVAMALNQGRKVPHEVLRDYPDLAAMMS